MRDPTTIDQLAEVMIELTREYLSDSSWDRIMSAAFEHLRQGNELLRHMEEVSDHMTLTRESLKTGKMPKKRSRLPRKRGRRTQAAFRDLEIATCIATIVANGFFKPTRSHTRGTRVGPHSACSIVQTALARLGEHRSERSIEDIWHRHKKGKFGPEQFDDLFRTR
jgi:hypothetical protein